MHFFTLFFLFSCGDLTMTAIETGSLYLYFTRLELPVLLQRISYFSRTKIRFMTNRAKDANSVQFVLRYFKSVVFVVNFSRKIDNFPKRCLMFISTLTGRREI